MMTSTILLSIPTNELLNMEPLVRKYIKSAMDKGIGETTYEQMFAKALVGQAIFWAAVVDDKIIGMASTEIMEFTNYRSVHLITTSIDPEYNWEDYHYHIEDYAKAIGARNIQFWGRKGWSRAIDKITGKEEEKYKEVYRVFAMELNNADPPV